MIQADSPKCMVCGYQLVDQHHLPARSRGGTHTIELCPNHHRCANMLQAWIYRGEAVEWIWDMASVTFDDAFNRELLNGLIAFELCVEADARAFFDVWLRQLNKRAVEMDYKFMRPRSQEANINDILSLFPVASVDTDDPVQDGQRPDAHA